MDTEEEKIDDSCPDGKVEHCQICMQPYGDGDAVIRLSCNRNHCFHQSCMEQWCDRGKD